MTDRTRTTVQWISVAVMLGSVLWALQALPLRQWAGMPGDRLEGLGLRGSAAAGPWILLGVALVAVTGTAALVFWRTRKPDRSVAESGEGEAMSGGNGRTLACAAGAAALLVGAAVVQAQSDSVASWLGRLAGGPPAVDMKEKYEQDRGAPTFDHGSFTSILQRHVDEAGWVDYQGLKDDTGPLDDYIARLAEAPFDGLDRDGKLALLINAYNAFTLKLVVEHLPLESIKDIPKAESWEDERWRVGTYTWSLNQIEHEQIRPNFEEPRIHFALVCAAVGCPPLANEAYRADTLDRQLARQTAYVHGHDTWLQLTDDGAALKLTKLYQWYGGDFEQAAGSVLEYVAEHSAAVRQAVAAGAEPTLGFLPYDWKLNDVSNRQPR